MINTEQLLALCDALEDAIAHIDILSGTICQLAEAGTVDSDESLVAAGQCLSAKRQIVKAITILLEAE